MASGEQAGPPQTILQPALGENVQAHLGRASRFADGRKRNWSLFFFFRILPEAELKNDFDQLATFMKAYHDHSDVVEEEGRKLLAALQYPAAVNAGIVKQKQKERDEAEQDKQPKEAKEERAPDEPATLFLDWLKVITGAGSDALAKTVQQKLSAAGISAAAFESPALPEVTEPVSGGSPPADTGGAAAAPMPVDRGGEEGIEFFSSRNSNFARAKFTDPKPMQILQDLWDGMRSMPGLISDPDKFKARLSSFGKNAGEAGLKALEGGLLRVCFYEMLRQIAPAQWKGPNVEPQPTVAGTAAITESAPPPPAAIRSEAREEARRPAAMRSEATDQAWRQAVMRNEVTAGVGQPKNAGDKEPKAVWDPVPINIAFTCSGLKALKLDETTLATFPEPFKEGMAARAERLGDTGPSAPEHWEGVLGLDRVHGYFTGGFQVGSEDSAVPHALWQRLREEIRAYNDRSKDRDQGQAMRVHLRTYFKLLGMDILHIELGEDPYEVDENGNVKEFEHRLEHFGFRDGISQPFVNLNLGAPAPGGGTPSSNRTWSPLAAGEIYLDQPDEDGNHHQLPANKLLRRGSTFLVFRKLEQDVAGFRTFLAKQRPEDRKAQRKLASQFVGRWQNGTSLVHAPDAPLALGPDADGLINDFLYAADDPKGLKCPLSAHVRRTNPRDIGGTNDVRRHRILRRGIGYGGPLLSKKNLRDGNKRGLLFIAVNSRIDLQFEVIQSNWINKGELLGQAGLNRCPLTGANLGGTADAFLEAGAAAPVTGLPRFVITRGGDYFFVPGVEALEAMATGCKFPVDQSELPYLGYSMGDAETPALYSEQRLKRAAARILAGKPSVIRMTLPPLSVPSSASPNVSASLAPPPTVAFVGQLADVKHVLSMKSVPPGQPSRRSSIPSPSTVLQSSASVSATTCWSRPRPARIRQLPARE